MKLGFRQSVVDACLFYKKDEFILLYVDDIQLIKKMVNALSFWEPFYS